MNIIHFLVSFIITVGTFVYAGAMVGEAWINRSNRKQVTIDLILGFGGLLVALYVSNDLISMYLEKKLFVQIMLFSLSILGLIASVMRPKTQDDNVSVAQIIFFIGVIALFVTLIFMYFYVFGN